MDNPDLISNILKVLLLQGSMILVYIIILKPYFPHKMKRWYLLSSLVLPFLITVPIPTEASSEGVIYSSTIPEINISILPNEEVHQSVSSFLSENITITIYSIGLLLLGSIFLVRLFMTIKLTRKSTPVLVNNRKIYLLKNISGPFSFLHRIYIPSSLFVERKELMPILLHEEAHTKQLHVIDLLFSELVVLLIWFNPFVWIIKKEIILNHEYLADQSVINNGIVLREYQMTLLEHSIARKYSFTISFKSHLKERIIMLNRKKLSLTGRIVLFFGAVLILFSSTLVSSRVVAKPQIEANEVLQNQVQDTGQSVVFPGGFDAMSAFIQKNLTYPEQARLKNIEGTVSVQLKFNTKGKIIDRYVLKGPDPELDKEAIRVVDLMPDWIPVAHFSDKEEITKVLIIRFKLDNAESKSYTDEIKYFVTPENEAEYPGGFSAMTSFIITNLVYPEQSKKDKNEGTVFVQFVITETGQIEQIKVLRGVCKELDEAAVNIIKKMPDWKPATQDGKAISSIYTMPIKYKLDKEIKK